MINGFFLFKGKEASIHQKLISPQWPPRVQNYGLLEMLGPLHFWVGPSDGQKFKMEGKKKEGCDVSGSNIEFRERRGKQGLGFETLARRWEAKHDWFWLKFDMMNPCKVPFQS